MNMEKCGIFIKNARKNLNMTQQALGEYLAVTDRAISKWERGLSCPDIDNLKNMAHLFHCSIAEIVNGIRLETTQSSYRPTETTAAPTPTEEYHKDVTVTFGNILNRSISPLLFGDNLEHTRGCIFGGLSAEILKNRKFISEPDRFGCAHDWYPVGTSAYFSFVNMGYNGNPSYTKHHKDHRMPRRNECNAQNITNFKPGRSGIGQKELYFRKDTDYEFVLAAKAFEEMTVTVTLLGADRTVYDSKNISVQPGEYREYEIMLHIPHEDADGSLEITFDCAGTLTIGAVSLMPTGHFRGMRRDVIEKIKELGITLLRWPGGNFAGDYNWKDGLLPRNMRAPYQSSLWLHTQPHTSGYDFHEFNTDDFIALCREIGAEPYITINPAWNTPVENAQWVEYCNGDETTEYGRIRMERGYKEPYNVQFWGLGNEAGHGHMEGPNVPEEYSKVVHEHAVHMLNVSPNLILLSSGYYPDMNWVKYAAKPLADVSSVISLHNYVLFPDFADPAKRKEHYNQVVSSVEKDFLRIVSSTREQLADDRIKISFDEWNAYHAWFRRGSVCEGIFTASMLNMLFRNADALGIIMACHFESVNEGALQVYPDRAVLSPTGQAISLMKEHINGMICAMEEDIVATRKHSIITCTLLNRSYDKSKKFRLENCGKPISSVLYSSEDIVPNTEFEIHELPVFWQDNYAEVTLPPHSIASIHMEILQENL